ncbi:MAG: hypothetical protein M1818_006809 [Claussenomyces sp. TS43310]|nr:MAG: hypothetical protein M1818_006809 [Claussenomyces sp. TS43310]
MAPVSKRRRAVVEEAESESDQDMHLGEAAAPSQNSARRRRQVAAATTADSDSDDGGDAQYHGDAMEIDGQGRDGDQEQLVKKFVRYALACEYGRVPIRRDGVRDKVFGKNKAPWKKILDATQHQLRTKFGMEMTELPLKEKVTLKDRLASKPNQTPTSSKSYILTSTLPPAYRSPTILRPAAIPTAGAEAAYAGLYTLIISLISLSGGKLADAKLDRYLRRLNADVNMPMDRSDQVLARMIRQGYLVRLREAVAGEEIVEWIVGPRGKLDVGHSGVRGLVAAAYGDAAPDDLDARIASSLGMDASNPESADRSGHGAQQGARMNGRRRRRGGGEGEEEDGEDYDQSS